MKQTSEAEMVWLFPPSNGQEEKDEMQECFWGEEKEYSQEEQTGVCAIFY